MNHHRPIELLRKRSFLVTAEVVSKFHLVAVLPQDFKRLFISDARKRRLNGLEFRDVAFERFDLARAIAQDRLHDVAHQSFAERHHVFQVRIGRLGLQHPEFGQVPARLGFFGAKRWPEAINLAQSRG